MSLFDKLPTTQWVICRSRAGAIVYREVTTNIELNVVKMWSGVLFKSERDARKVKRFNFDKRSYYLEELHTS